MTGVKCRYSGMASLLFRQKGSFEKIAMKTKIWSGLVLLAAVFLIFPAQETLAGELLSADFACRSLVIGDDESRVKSVFGEPVYEKNVCIEGIFVRECDYAGDFTVGISCSTGKVIDIISKGKEYEARNGIRYGATSGWITKTYGKAPRTMLGGNIFYIYTNPEDGFQHLMIQVDSEDGHLLTLRITGLPMDEEEREKMMKAQPELFEEPDDDSFALIPSGYDINVSALPKSEPVKLGGQTE